MKTKLSDWVLVLSCFILVTGTFVLSTSGEVWENEYGRIEVYPDVSRELITQKQFYNVTWYYPDNDLDIAFCFNESLSYGGVYYWNGTSYKKALIEHIVYNSKHYYVLSEIHFAQDEIKHGYWEYNTPVNSSGKWDMFIKLSSDTWMYAFDNDRLVHLDPWWNSSWSYHQSSCITNNVTDYSMLLKVYNNSDAGDFNCHGYANANFSDLRFVKDNTTELYHWMEYIEPDNFTWVWINVSDADYINVYYGNSLVGNSSYNNPNLTFFYFEDFDDISEWTSKGDGQITIASGWCTLTNDGSDSYMYIDLGQDDYFMGSRGYHSVSVTGSSVHQIMLSKDIDASFAGLESNEIDIEYYNDQVLFGARGRENDDAWSGVQFNNDVDGVIMRGFVSWAGSGTIYNDNMVIKATDSVSNQIVEPRYLYMWIRNKATGYVTHWDYIYVGLHDSTEPSFCEWSGNVTTYCSTLVALSNESPVDGSEVSGINVSYLNIEVAFTEGSGDSVNISVVADNGLFYNNDTTGIVNDTYSLNVIFANFSADTTYTWYVNVTGSGCVVGDSFTFVTTPDCGCYDELQDLAFYAKQIRESADDIQGDDFSSDTDSLSKMMSDIMINPVLMAIVLMLTFFVLAERKEDYLLYVLSGILALVMGVYYIILLEGISYVSWIGVILILFGVYCFFLSLAYSLKKRSRK